MSISNQPTYFDQLRSFAINRTFFSNEECEKIKTIGLSQIAQEATIGHNLVDEHTRKSRVCWIEEDDDSEWLFARLQHMILQVNSRFYRYDIYAFEPLQFTVYDQVGDHYDYHTDAKSDTFLEHDRKLSFTVQLSDSNDYEGGDIEIFKPGDSVLGPREKGSLAIFSSLAYHKVHPLTSGTRISLVGWVIGKPFT